MDGKQGRVEYVYSVRNLYFAISAWWIASVGTVASLLVASLLVAWFSV